MARLTVGQSINWGAVGIVCMGPGEWPHFGFIFRLYAHAHDDDADWSLFFKRNLAPIAMARHCIGGHGCGDILLSSRWNLLGFLGSDFGLPLLFVIKTRSKATDSIGIFN